MNRLHRSIACVILLAPAMAAAASLPLDVDVNGNTTTIRVGVNPAAPMADVRLDFDDATGLSTASLGLAADSVSVSNPTLLARLPSTQVTIPAGLHMLLTVQPPTLGGLAFDRRVHVEIHTHLLAYTVGSRYRLFKAPLNGAFRDVTGSVEPGSVRTRGTTGGFSQFLIAKDLRPTDVVIAEKIEWLRDQVDLLAPSSEAPPLHVRLDYIEAAVAAEDWDVAMVWIDNFKVRVTNRAGTYIPETWSANGSTVNSAGELLSGLDTLAFSIGFLRDFGP